MELMPDKHTQVRNYLLDLLENGSLEAGDKFPGARLLAQQLGVSFLLVQHVVNGLVQDGVLVSVPRRGVYVRKLWKARRISNHFVPFSRTLPYIQELSELMRTELPELRCCSKFHSGVFEIRTSLSVQSNRASYLDLAPYFEMDSEKYFSRPFEGFKELDGRLFGIPFIWSPRIMLYRKDLLEKHGIYNVPQDLNISGFIDMVKILRRSLPPEKICNYCDVMSFYMNMVFGAGGSVLERRKNGSTEVKLDTARTLRGIKALRDLRIALEIGKSASALSLADKNEMAFLFADRECVSMLDNRELWNAIPLPSVSIHAHKIFQSTELICVRRECTDTNLVEKFVRFMLGSKVQNMIGKLKYGIPIMREAAAGSLDMDCQLDRLFESEAEFTATGNIDSTELLSFAYGAILDAVNSEKTPEEVISPYANAMRLVCNMRNNPIFKRAVHQYERDAAAFNLEAVAFDM